VQYRSKAGWGKKNLGVTFIFFAGQGGKAAIDTIRGEERGSGSLRGRRKARNRGKKKRV